MFSVSKNRWHNAQNAEKQAFGKSKIKKPVFDVVFFSRNFSITSDFFNDKHVLEVGCSPLAAIHSISNARFKLGVEPLASEWADFYEKDTDHVQGIGEYLPVKSESIDIVLCINVLDHVHSPSSALNAIQTCLNKEGTLLLWVQTFSTLNIIKKLLGILDKPHPHHFGHDEVYSLLKDLNFKIISQQRNGADIHSAISLIREGMFISGLKSLLANLFLGLHESSFVCSKTVNFAEK